MHDRSKPAFPGMPQGEGFVGMTLREWYAGMALQGLLANSDRPPTRADDMANLAFAHADAMIWESAEKH